MRRASPSSGIHHVATLFSAGVQRLPYRRVRTTLVACVLLLALPLRETAAHLSLFPTVDPGEKLSHCDGLAPAPPRLALGRWQPFGLDGVSVSTLAVALDYRRLNLAFGLESQDWTLLRAWRSQWRISCEHMAFLRLGLAGEHEALHGGEVHSRLDLLMSMGDRLGRFRLSVRHPLANSSSANFAMANTTTTGIGFTHDVWTLRAFRELDSGGPSRNGISFMWSADDIALGLITGASQWQGGSFEIWRGRWGLKYRCRLHPALGASHGVFFIVR